MRQVLLQGLALGGLYAASAIGLSLVFGVLRLVNLAHGELLVGAAFLAFAILAHVSIEPMLVALGVGVVLGAAAYGVQRGMLTPLMRRGEEPPLVATFGISIAIQSALLLRFTANPIIVNAGYATDSVTILGVRIRTVLLLAAAIAVGLVVALQYLVRSTGFGRRLRAATVDPEAAAAVGIDVAHVYGMTMALAALTAALGGVLVAITFSVAPTSGTGWLLRAFTAVVIGGMGSITGTLGGGLVLGVVETAGAALVGPQYRDVVVFGALVVFLLLRPQGVFAGVKRS